jgi:hypothetical protein
VAHAALAQGVRDGADDHGRRGGGAAFPARLDAERFVGESTSAISVAKAGSVSARGTP